MRITWQDEASVLTDEQITYIKNRLTMNKNNALFDFERQHRIWLSRVWDQSKPKVLFIGLNPSTADAEKDDPTIRKVKAIAEFWGYGGVYMMNLFTFISTDPKKLNITDGNILGADFHLKQIADKCELIVFAWGNFKVNGRDKEVIAMFPDAIALHINKNGTPKHPLYCLNESIPVKFKTQ